MGYEIERKFLIANDAWRGGIVGERHLRDGLVARFGQGKVRVRIDAERAWITVKGPRVGFARPEFEYPIPLGDAEAMLASLCDGPVVEKTRYLVPHDGLVWEVDIYDGILGGLAFAEVELPSVDHPLRPPHWVGREVTGDPKFRQAALLQAVGGSPALAVG
ncbi:CYTH domain-containing protein [Marinivivus vitaminiproducens]|uniref:CYTH domain-containing protein n=1 Tax=Marinivivus vitaminiproducens TaxID=3035935 RepID=UPI0027A77DDF|nr:CYTH domain-containing protein [Geminicoccaceae bacterium SCSIO 64248]